MFERVGVCKVDEFLQGYNATVLAYGQTGSGKTYTMLGARPVLRGVSVPFSAIRCLCDIISSVSFVVSGALGAKNTGERGLIPRILEYMFEEVAKRPEVRC